MFLCVFLYCLWRPISILEEDELVKENLTQHNTLCFAQLQLHCPVAGLVTRARIIEGKLYQPRLESLTTKNPLH